MAEIAPGTGRGKGKDRSIEVLDLLGTRKHLMQIADLAVQVRSVATADLVATTGGKVERNPRLYGDNARYLPAA